MTVRTIYPGETLSFPTDNGWAYIGSAGTVYLARLDSEEVRDYWIGLIGLAVIPPPPDGFVYVMGDEGVRLLPELPVGESYYRVAVWNQPCILIPDWCHGPYATSQPIGPSVRDCSVSCLFADGCSHCNPTVWAECIGGGCIYPDAYRVPRATADRGECPCDRPCNRCEAATHPNSWRYTSEDGYVCRRCQRLYYSSCGHCDGYYRDETISDHESYCAEDCESGCCSQEEEYDSADGLIHDYSYTPRLQFRGEAPYYLGLELEISTGRTSSYMRDVAEYVANGLGDVAYLKEDSSIDGGGFEIVTHPMSYAWALEHFPWKVIEGLSTEHGIRDDHLSSCGIHVHVSRTAFDSASHMYRWMKFFYRARRPIVQIARRESGYAKWETPNNTWAVHHAMQASKTTRPADAWDWQGAAKAWYLKTPGALNRYYHAGQTDRYSAINVDNDATVEVRVFGATVNPDSVRAALGLVHATVEYARIIDASAVLKNRAFTFDAFRGWVKDNNPNGQYDSLLSEIERLVH